MNEPKIACLCCTYGRPELLPHAVESFLRQDYPDDKCELVILDDAGQYSSQSHQEPKRWEIVSVRRRFNTLGEKRNALAALASPDCDAFAVWDDDDIYLPHALRAHAAALASSEWSVPSVVLTEAKDGSMVRKNTEGLFHAAHAFSARAFKRAGGYPSTCSGQDKGLFRRMEVDRVRKADPIALGYAPYFICRMHATDWHSSAAHGTDYYQSHVVKPEAVIETIVPGWPKPYDTMVEQ